VGERSPGRGLRRLRVGRLWKVIATGTGNGFECEATALINVEDDHELDPLATIAGLGGLGLAIVGALGILGVASRIGKSRAAPFSGILLGAVLGIGVAVLLQQFSVVYRRWPSWARWSRSAPRSASCSACSASPAARATPA
jgi:hypothetical protein